MNKKNFGWLSVIFLVPAMSASPLSQASLLKSMSSSLIPYMKDLIKPTRFKTAIMTKLPAIWAVAKIGAITTVLANIVLPQRLKQFLARQRIIRHFIFMNEHRPPFLGTSINKEQAGQKNSGQSKKENAVDLTQKSSIDECFKFFDECLKSLGGSLEKLQALVNIHAEEVDKLSRRFEALNVRLDRIEQIMRSEQDVLRGRSKSPRTLPQ